MKNDFLNAAELSCEELEFAGHEIIVDQDGEGSDFKDIYPDLDVNGTFTITAAYMKQGVNTGDDHLFTPEAVPDGVKIIEFEDSKGRSASGRADRFLLPDIQLVEV